MVIVEAPGVDVIIKEDNCERGRGELMRALIPS